MMEVESSRLVVVSCANYGQYVAIALRNLFDSRRGADFELSWVGNTVRAHRIILELFLATETIDFNVRRRHDPFGIKQELPENDWSSGDNVLESLLEFLYKGEVTVPEEQLEELLRASKELDFKMLEDAVDEACKARAAKVQSLANIEEEVENLSEKRIESIFYVDFGMHNSIQDQPPASANDSGSLEIAPPTLELLRASKELDYYVVEDAVDEACKSRVVELENLSNSEKEVESFSEKSPGSSCYMDFEMHNSIQDQSPASINGSGSLEIAPPATNKLYKCHICKFQSFLARKHRRHLLGVHGLYSNGFQAPVQSCPYCEFESSATDKYREHLVRTHEITTKGEPAPRHKCPHCEFAATGYNKYYSHLTFFHGLTVKGDPIPIYKCAHCKFQSTLKGSYKHHCASAHGRTIDGEPAPKHKCPHCDFESTVYQKYCHHLLHVHCVTVSGKPARILKCAYCEYATYNSASYRHHSKAIHGKTTQGETAPKHKCPECDFSTPFVNAFNRHCKSAHSQERSFACEYCSYAGKAIGELRRHRNIVHGVGDCRFMCKVCGKRCSSHSMLELHSRVHSKKAKLALTCEICSRLCTTRSGFQRHKKACAKERDAANANPGLVFTCEICSKRCFSSSGLGRHKRLHTSD